MPSLSVSGTQNRGLSAQLKIWWLLNAITFIHVVVVVAEDFYYDLTGNTFGYRSIYHFIYNISSPPFLPAYYLFYFFSIFFIGFEKMNTIFGVGTQAQLIIHAIVFGISIITSLIISKLLTMQFIVDFYNRSFGRNKLLLVVFLIIICYLFYIG